MKLAIRLTSHACKECKTQNPTVIMFDEDETLKARQKQKKTEEQC